MPIYSFTCKAPDCAGNIYDIRLPIDDRNEPQFCPVCEDEMTRIITVPVPIGFDEYGRSGYEKHS